MKYQLLAAITALLIVCGPAATAQRLAGKIVDAATGQPVPYASIAVLNTTLGTTSNAEGEFELRAELPARLVMSELGHQRDTVQVAVAAATTPLQVRLQPVSVLLPEVQVGSYLGDLLAQAYRQMLRTHSRMVYGQAFYRQVVRIGGDATEVQEMVWEAASSSGGMSGSSLAHGRFAKKEAPLGFKNFSNLTKAVGFNLKADSLTRRSLLGLYAARYFKLTLIGVTQSAGQQLVEIGFENKPGLTQTTAKGTLVINETTKQVLRLRYESPDLVNIKTNGAVVNIQTNGLLVKLRNQTTVFEMDFQPTPDAAVLTYIRVDYQATLAGPAQRDVAVHASSFAYFYNGRPAPNPSVTYAPPRGGEADLTTIKKTAYDPAFWQNNAVVKRTPLEDQVMKSFEQKGAFGTMLTP
ncbi:carboxypeptidase-like regulatory domain-containing protein [Hymenobacter sp. IS2118]|uniref:carboxypeptidase-like regulatory domain-containing protein n=1 Tax=Hymenobacter sp. IS2118 TaxID=1505605 RepID=UPI00055224F5|nr:carboxypeptidase-like regulatory domain-containing protein [Hymenobacter sp. IS2118]